MFDSKFYTTMVSLVVAVIVICNYNPNKKEEIQEGWMPSLKVRTQTDMFTKSLKTGDTLSDFGTKQANLSPRYANLNQQAILNYHMAGQGCNNQASCGQPVTSQEHFTDMARETTTKEEYCPKCNGGECACREKPYMSGDILPPDYHYGDYKEVAGDNRFPETSDTLPVTSMDTLDSLGQEVQHVMVDRLMYANRNSRLRALGDPIRGDLPIAPCQSDWFRPSVNPNIDLQTGALAVLGGYDNNQGQALAALMGKESGGTDSLVGGIDMATQKGIESQGFLSSINVTAFP